MHLWDKDRMPYYNFDSHQILGTPSLKIQVKQTAHAGTAPAHKSSTPPRKGTKTTKVSNKTNGITIMMMSRGVQGQQCRLGSFWRPRLYQ